MPTGEKTLVSNKKSEKTCYLAGYAINCYHSSPRDHWVGEETDAANKTSFLAKRNHLLPFKLAVETEQIKSDKVAKAPEALLKGCKVPGKKGPLYNQNLSSKTSSLRLKEPVG